MKKVWKWILGIVLGLIVLAVLFCVGFIVFRNFHAYRGEARNAPGFSQRGPQMMMPNGGFQYMRGPGMMNRGIVPFGGFFGGLLAIGFLALVVLGIIWLVRSLRTPKRVDVPAAAPVAMPVEVTNLCKKCGKPLQSDWHVCPNCGKKI